MKLFRNLAIIAGSGLVSVALSSGAWAFYSAGATATATAQVGTLAPPTAVTGVQTGAGTVHLQWTGSAGGSVAPNGYYVERLSGPTASPACGSSATSPLASGASGCDDTGVAVGSYTYRVTAVSPTWTATSDPSGDVTVGDVAPAEVDAAQS